MCGTRQSELPMGQWLEEKFKTNTCTYLYNGHVDRQNT